MNLLGNVASYLEYLLPKATDIDIINELTPETAGIIQNDEKIPITPEFKLTDNVQTCIQIYNTIFDFDLQDIPRLHLIYGDDTIYNYIIYPYYVKEIYERLLIPLPPKYEDDTDTGFTLLQTTSPILESIINEFVPYILRGKKFYIILDRINIFEPYVIICNNYHQNIYEGSINSVILQKIMLRYDIRIPHHWKNSPIIRTYSYEVYNCNIIPEYIINILNTIY